MNATAHLTSAVREASPFRSPPRVRVLADAHHAGEALALAEALEVCGAEADVRVGDDLATAAGTPDAVVVDVGWVTGEMADHCRGLGPHPVVVAVAEADDWEGRERARTAGYDLVVTRPLSAEKLLVCLGEQLPGLLA